MRKRVFFGILGIAAAVLGVEVTRDDTAAIGVAASGSVPLRIEFSLAERAHAAAPQPPAAAVEPAAAAAVGLRMELAMSAPPDAGPEAPPPAPQSKAASGEPESKPAPPAGAVRLDLLTRARDLGEAGAAFGAKSWVVAPPPPPPPPTPVAQAPQAPPLPFRFMGQLDDGRGHRTFFLTRGAATLSVSVGESIDNTYLLERAEGGVLHFTYLPLRQPQSLQIGAGP